MPTYGCKPDTHVQESPAVSLSGGSGTKQELRSGPLNVWGKGHRLSHKEAPAGGGSGGLLMASRPPLFVPALHVLALDAFLRIHGVATTNRSSIFAAPIG